MSAGPDTTARRAPGQAPAPIESAWLDGVLWLSIHRPERRNALSLDCLDALRDALLACDAHAELKLVVLRGSGDKAFAAGGDLQEFDALRSARDAEAIFDRAAAALDAVRACPVPVVAALNGVALGGGAELAMSCDYRIAAQHARIGFVQASLGITTGFGGGAAVLRRLGRAGAMRLLAQARLYSADEALQQGLVDRVCAPGQSLEDCVTEFAAPFLERAPHLVRAIKQLLGSAAPDAGQRAQERAAFAATWEHPLHWQLLAGMQQARMSKEKP